MCLKEPAVTYKERDYSLISIYHWKDYLSETDSVNVLVYFK